MRGEEAGGRRVWRQFLRFLAVGGSATAIHYLTLVLGVEWLALAPTPASAIGFCLSAVYNYWANYHWTFASDRAHQEAAPRFALVAGVGLVLNSLIMATLAEGLAIHYVAAQVLATGVVLLWNFAANRHWTYAASKRS